MTLARLAVLPDSHPMKRSIPFLFATLLAACAGAPPTAPQHSFDVHALAERPSASTRTLADPQGKAVLVTTQPTLTQRDVQQAELASVVGSERERLSLRRRAWNALSDQPLSLIQHDLELLSVYHMLRRELASPKEGGKAPAPDPGAGKD